MATKIDLGAVKNALNRFSTANSQCVASMKRINQKYIEGTQTEWNTPAAAQYIDAIVSSFNDYINQFNEKFRQGAHDFVKGVNVLAEQQKASTVSAPALTPIAHLSRGWAPQSEKFNIPDDYAGFTSSNLTSGINELVSHLGDMQRCIEDAVNNGLAGQFCTQLREGLAKLKSSAQSVAEEYNGDAAKKAVDEDTTIHEIKSNT